MLKKKIAEFGEEYCFEELENGLKVYVFSKPDFNTTYAAFGTPFGALDLDEEYDGKRYNFHAGIAHFLEHKLFEEEDGDVLGKFSKMGAYVNAMTSYTETIYYFSIAQDKHLSECLDLLLDFTQQLNIDEASVEKEKPIIIEEISMYKQLPDARLLEETYKALYHHYPLIYDIGGDEESVKAITLKELKECYQINYHPSNMILCITTFIDPFKIMQIIKDNQKAKAFIKHEPARVNLVKEPKEVAKKSSYLAMDVNSFKHVYGIKLDLCDTDIYELIRKEKALRFALQMLFSNMNPDYQKWLDEGKINYFFGYDVNLTKDASFMIFYNENNTAQDLKDLIDETLKKASFKEEDLIQLKRRYLGNYFTEFNDPEAFTLTNIRNLLDDIDIFKSYEIVNDLSIKDLNEILHDLDLSNYSLVTVGPKIAE